MKWTPILHQYKNNIDRITKIPSTWYVLWHVAKKVQISLCSRYCTGAPHFSSRAFLWFWRYKSAKWRVSTGYLYKGLRDEGLGFRVCRPIALACPRNESSDTLNLYTAVQCWTARSIPLATARGRAIFQRRKNFRRSHEMTDPCMTFQAILGAHFISAAGPPNTVSLTVTRLR